MSKAEILEELPNLKPEERLEVMEKIRELDGLAGDEWLDPTDRSVADKVLLEARLAADEHDPDASSSGLKPSRTSPKPPCGMTTGEPVWAGSLGGGRRNQVTKVVEAAAS